MTHLLRAEGNQKTSATAVGTSSGCSATLTHTAGDRLIVSHISGSGDAAALVTLESPAGTVLWQQRFAAAFAFSQNFAYGEIPITDGNDAVLKISASTTHSEANIAGVLAGL